MTLFWKNLAPPNDPFTLARDVAPVRERPGSLARYSNTGIAMLAWCVTASLRGASEADLRTLLAVRVFGPLGVPDAEWDVGYGGTVVVDGLPLVPSWGGAAFSADAAARVGRLLLHEGDWNGRRVLSRESAQALVTHAGHPNNAGLGWFVNLDGDGAKHWASAPAEAFWGAGAGHQFLFVAPREKLIVVRYGDVLDRGPFDDALERYIVAPLMDALIDSAQSGPSR
jgi:CubicO group peptidase (beta-lactamase class C family)